MFVVVVAVSRVKMAVVEVVHVISVGYGDVTALGSVLVVVVGVLHALVEFAGVPMVVMAMMDVTIVHVVDMVAVSDRDMTAVGSVHVRVSVVGSMVHPSSMASVSAPGSSLRCDMVSNRAWPVGDD